MAESASRPLTIELLRLPKGERAVVALAPVEAGEAPIWTLGEDGPGIVAQSTTGGTVALQQLTVDHRRILVIPSADIEGLRLLVRVRSGARLIGGEAELRGSASARFTSPCDAVNILGFSSWYCRLF